MRNGMGSKVYTQCCILFPGSNLAGEVTHPIVAFPAGSAFTARFMFKKLSYIYCQIQHTSFFTNSAGVPIKFLVNKFPKILPSTGLNSSGGK